MSIKISGVSLGNLTGGPSAIALADLNDVSIVAPVTGDYLRYNGSIEEWQNVTIDSDVYNFLDSYLSGSDGVVVITTPGPNTVSIGLGNITPDSVAASGTVTGSNLSGTNTGDQTITLTGDVTGSGTGSFVATLSTTGVTPGSYTNSDITVDAKGRITAISNGSGGGGGTVTSVGITGNDGIVVGNSPITTSGSITLDLGNITPDSVAASGTVTGSNLSGTNTGDQTITLTGDVTGSGTGSFVATLSNTGVSAGTYTSVTVDAKGRVTAGTNPTTLSGYGITDAVAKAGDTMTGALGIISGTAASPGIFVTGSPSTGVYSPVADSVSVATLGTERIRVTSTGDTQFRSITTDSWTGYGNVSGSINISLSTSNYISFTITGTTTITFTNPPANFRVGSYLLEITNGGSAAITWTDVTWISGSAPTLRPSGINLIGIITRNGGATYLGTLVA